MNSRISLGKIKQRVAIMLSALLVLAFLIAYSPGPAQAACSFKYTVQSGDTLYKIAAIYGVEFKSLVEENKIIAPYLIYVGQVLCIPPGGEAPATTPSSPGTTTTTTTTTKKVPTITALHLHSIVWVGLTNFPKNRFYYVKSYTGGVGYWTFPNDQLGMIQTDKNGAFGAWFHLPTNFQDLKIITVCLKDVLNDDVVDCAQLFNPDHFLFRRGLPE